MFAEIFLELVQRLRTDVPQVLDVVLRVELLEVFETTSIRCDGVRLNVPGIGVEIELNDVIKRDHAGEQVVAVGGTGRLRIRVLLRVVGRRVVTLTVV